MAPVAKTSWHSIEPETLTEGITRKFVNGEKVMMAEMNLRQGEIVPEHSHVNEQISWVLEGALLFEIEGKSITLGEGEILVIPSGVPHRVTALQDTRGIDVFSPIRHDWIRKEDHYLRGK